MQKKYGKVDGESVRLTDSQIQERGQEAYDAVLKDSKPYQLYKEQIEKRMKGSGFGSDLFVFSKKRSDELSEQISAMVSGAGSEKGLVQVWDENNKQLDDDTWNEIKNDMKAIGVTYTGDPLSPYAVVLRSFSAAKGKKTEGKDMIVRLPNTNIMSVIQNDLTPEQRYYLSAAGEWAKRLKNTPVVNVPIDTNGTGLGNKQPVTIQRNFDDGNAWKFGDGFKVKVGKNETMVTNFRDMIEFIDKHAR